MSNKKGGGRLVSASDEIEEESDSMKQRLLHHNPEKGTSLNAHLIQVDSLIFEDEKPFQSEAGDQLDESIR